MACLFAPRATLRSVYPSVALVALYVAGSLRSYIKSELERSFVRSAFSHYLAAPLVEELANNHERLKLGGEMREVTVLFADVRGFSKISEGLEAEALIRFVNEIFTPLSEVILAQRGTIDKFMGDAVMAFWNAPVPDPFHAANASQAALGMLYALDELNGRRAAEAAARGEAVSPIRIGVGLNTGECCVGNMGSPQRFDYSILGELGERGIAPPGCDKSLWIAHHRRRTDRCGCPHPGFSRDRCCHTSWEGAIRTHLCSPRGCYGGQFDEVSGAASVYRCGESRDDVE